MLLWGKDFAKPDFFGAPKISQSPKDSSNNKEATGNNGLTVKTQEGLEDFNSWCVAGVAAVGRAIGQSFYRVLLLTSKVC